ncbi:MAG: alanine racemase, partial [Candidatus Marinimicrobia bacterium]|nr:alanine racemase [Candidatus Neomarinimicrobiota bacterium]
MNYIGPKIYIDLERLANNCRLLKNEVGDIPIMATVKANGYGHGAVQVAKTLAKEGIKHFAVFTIEEGIELRDASITADILVYSRLNPNTLSEAETHNLILNVSSFDDLEALKAHQGNHKIRVHLKVDTGMTRLGIPLEQAEEFLQQAHQIDTIEVEGLYSHFA